MAAELEQTGPLSDRRNTLLQQLQGDVQELTTIPEQLDKEIVERKQIERALETSNEELNDFIYMTSHDFREPLRKISSFGPILKESLDGKIEPEDMEYLGFMIDGAERMNQMIEDLLAYSRITTKAITHEEVDLNDVVTQLETLDLGPILEETGTHIEIPHPLPNVLADPILIRQLFRNLILHAIKQRKEDTHVQIIIGTERIAEDEVKIELQEKGVSIERKNDKDLFKMSLQSHSRQDYEEAGTSLAVCKKIVDRLGGRIGINTNKGDDLTFWLILPTATRLERKPTELTVNRTGSPTLS
jgi:light-regulated signal transduction histidine kinase (bacteriophytochrome)